MHWLLAIFIFKKNPMASKIKTIVLTSKKNYVWQSMQEIIPFLVDSWIDSAKDNHQVSVVDVDSQPLTVYFQNLIAADNIVLTCFTPRLFKVAAYIRNELRLNCRFIIHLHNQATIACWPMRYWGDKSLFYKNDIFVSSCARDSECLKLTYPEAKTVVIPFSYKTSALQKHIPFNNHIPFIFVGRISEQKNLHTLFYSLSLLQKMNPDLSWTLDLIGREDFLGSPNMGLKGIEYRKQLEHLAVELNIDTQIHFHGLQDRESIEKLLHQQRWIFAVPSLHSDENFGMAAFQFLRNGHIACLSDWGGHTDFKKYFSNQTFLTTVRKTDNGPFIDPTEYAHCLEQGVQNYRNFYQAQPSYYEYENIVQKNFELAVLQDVDALATVNCLKASEIAEAIFARLPTDIKDLSAPAIFHSYSDPLAHHFFTAYGMQKESS